MMSRRVVVVCLSRVLEGSGVLLTGLGVTMSVGSVCSRIFCSGVPGFDMVAIDGGGGIKKLL